MCTGKAYTDNKPLCNGWPDLTAEQCMTKCTENAHEKSCGKGITCGTALLYMQTERSKTGWCHLFTKKGCETMIDVPTMIISFEKIQSEESGRRMFEITSEIDWLRSSSPLLLGAGACLFVLCIMLSLWKRHAQSSLAVSLDEEE
jgi:hypothetical protein